ncbi:hypothetical protein HYC85_023599 [Camellia sinensis]|uniref:PCI domain-containing protein n=1 Tax=Camellia sinensis TaxID=4442 RepID=A0A7J7GF33_CAMSI|nr:hypothetical protein HYC85_023599 [Camellia sinensis]
MESAQAKNQALHDAGAVVPTSFEAFETVIKETFEKLSKVVERHFHDIIERYGETVKVDLTDKFHLLLHGKPKSKYLVVDALEIFTVIGKIPHLLGFLNSLYDCQYNWPDGANKIGPLFASPLPVYMREVRTVVYSQFLESYESVTIEAMAKAFGVTVEFIDLELSRFIAAGKLHCKIDKVAGVLETNRPDAKNALYQATIKQGDFLLNRIQKLSRIESEIRKYDNEFDRKTDYGEGVESCGAYGVDYDYED